jgi:hypothetical protein
MGDRTVIPFALVVARRPGLWGSNKGVSVVHRLALTPPATRGTGGGPIVGQPPHGTAGYRFRLVGAFMTRAGLNER